MTDHYIEVVPLNGLAKVPNRPVRRARKRALDSSKLTFYNLQDLLHQRINRGDGPSASSLPNLHSALSSFLTEQQLTAEMPIGSIFRACYYKYVKAHTASLQKEKRSKDYITNRRSLLAHWRKCVIDYDRYCAIDLKKAHPFQQALQDIVATFPSQRSLARDSGIPLATLKRWLHGAIPHAGSIHHVAKLERLLGLEPGQLRDLLPERFLQADSLGEHAETKIPYRVRLATASKVTYAVKEPTDRLRREWTEFLQYKVSELDVVESSNDDDEEYGDEKPGLRRSTNGRWSSTSAAVAVPKASNWFAFYRGKYVATANIKWSQVSQFTGWLMLSESDGGKGMSAYEAQTLSNLARRNLVRAHVEWKIERAGGRVHSGILGFLQFISSLCNPRTGYLTQSQSRVADAESTGTERQWRNRCEATFDSVCKLRAELSQHSETSRDPFEPIQHVLSLQNPLEAIADMTMRINIAKPSTGGKREAIWARDKLLVKLLASNPLRDKNMRMLSYRPDNKGHLRQDARGGWFIFVPRRELKNFRGAARDRDYSMQVRPEVWSDIDEYLRHYRPMLLKTTTDRFFISEHSGGPFATQGLARRFEMLTRKYLQGCPGVGPHAMRHIVATSILKASPNDWNAAAWALHDREETVRAHYAHLAQHDAAQWLEKSFGGPFARMH